jgi:hypothetical protein
MACPRLDARAAIPDVGGTVTGGSITTARPATLGSNRTVGKVNLGKMQSPDRMSTIIRQSKSAERAIHIAERKRLYEAIHPETKHGAVGRGGKKEPNSGSFSDDTAKKTGRSKSSVKTDATRAKHIPQIADTVTRIRILDRSQTIPPKRPDAAKARSRKTPRAQSTSRKSPTRSEHRSTMARNSTRAAIPDVGGTVTGGSITTARPATLSADRLVGKVDLGKNAVRGPEVSRWYAITGIQAH